MLNKTPTGQGRRWLAMAGLAATTISAQAADPAQNGLMSFPNARVASAAEAGLKVEAAPAAESAGGFKAFVDPASGRLSHPTAEQAAELEAAGRPQASGKTQAQTSAQPTTFYGPDGAVGMRLDESHMSYSVARKNSQGAIDMACLPEKEAAMFQQQKAGKAQTPKATAKGEQK